MTREMAAKKIEEILEALDDPRTREAAKVIEEAMDGIRDCAIVIDPVDPDRLTSRIRALFASGIELEDLLMRVRFRASASERKIEQLRAGLRAYSAEAAMATYLDD